MRAFRVRFRRDTRNWRRLSGTAATIRSASHVASSCVRLKSQQARSKKSSGGDGIEGAHIRVRLLQELRRFILWVCNLSRPATGPPYRRAARCRIVAGCSSRSSTAGFAPRAPTMLPINPAWSPPARNAPISRRSRPSTHCESFWPPCPRRTPSRYSHGTNSRYRARVSRNEVPGNSVSLSASRIRPIPSSSRLLALREHRHDLPRPVVVGLRIVKPRQNRRRHEHFPHARIRPRNYSARRPLPQV